MHSTFAKTLDFGLSWSRLGGNLGPIWRASWRTTAAQLLFVLALGLRRLFFCSQVASGSDFEASLDLILAVLSTIFGFCDRALEHVLRPHNVFLV